MSRPSNPATANRMRNRHRGAAPRTTSAAVGTSSWTQDTRGWLSASERRGCSALWRRLTCETSSAERVWRCGCTPADTRTSRLSASRHPARCWLDAPRKSRHVGCRRFSCTTAVGRTGSVSRWA